MAGCRAPAFMIACAVAAAARRRAAAARPRVDVRHPPAAVS
jgi:hypothetical protein